MKDKKITGKQIEMVLQTIYQTNIPASGFDALKSFFSSLPNHDAKPEKEDATTKKA